MSITLSPEVGITPIYTLANALSKENMATIIVLNKSSEVFLGPRPIPCTAFLTFYLYQITF